MSLNNSTSKINSMHGEPLSSPRNLTEFTTKVQEYRRLSGNSQKELASNLGLHPKVLSRKLSSTSDALLTQPEIKQIIKTLAGWGAFYRQREAFELMKLAGLPPTIFTEEDWQSRPLNRLVLIGEEEEDGEDEEPANSDLNRRSLQPDSVSYQTKNLADQTSGKVRVNVPNNLPAQLNRFIGREEALDHLTQILATEYVRLVTLTGPGGVGKTRLSTRLGSLVSNRFEDGVWFVSLAGVSDPEFIVDTIARTLNLTLNRTGQRTILEELKDFLRPRTLLLILDNFEQLLDGAYLIGELLEAAPDLKIIVSSRIVLKIYGETEFVLGPLNLPDPHNLENIQSTEAVTFFIERVRSINSGMTFTERDLLTVGQVCTRLDGLPLALELAAARTRWLSLNGLLEQITLNSLQTLVEGARNLPARHQTLRNTIGWSFSLLDATEQEWFARLSVFRGGWSVKAAHEICATDGTSITKTAEILRSLAEKSLIIRESGENKGTAETRFGIFETLREFALEQLEGKGDLIAFQFRHANYYLELAGQSEDYLNGPTQVEWLDRLNYELNNFRAALNFSLVSSSFPTNESVDNKLQAERHFIGLKLASSLKEYWVSRGLWKEGLDYLEQALQFAPEKDNPETEAEKDMTRLLAKALNAAAQLARIQSLNDQTSRLAQKSLKLSLAINDSQNAGLAHSTLGDLALYQGEYTLANNHYQESLAYFYLTDYLPGIGNVLLNVGNISRFFGDFEAARESFQASLAIFKKVNNKFGQANAILGLAHNANMHRDVEEAYQLYDECLILFRELDNQQGIANVLSGLGAISNHLGKSEASRGYYLESLKIYREAGNKLGVTNIINNLGNAALSHGDDLKAFEYFQEALTLCGQINDQMGLILAYYKLGSVALSRGRMGEASQNFKAGLALARQSGDRQNVPKILRALGDLALCEGNLSKAAAFYEEGLDLARKSGVNFVIGRNLLSAALLAHLQKDYAGLQMVLKEGLEFVEEMGDMALIVQGLGLLAIIKSTHEDKAEEAIKIVGSVEKLKGELELVLELPFRQVYSETVTRLQALVSPLRYSRAFDAGKALSYKNILADNISGAARV